MFIVLDSLNINLDINRFKIIKILAAKWIHVRFVFM